MFRYKSCGKINSFLNVLRKLPNGYHQITTHYQLIDIFDENLKKSITNYISFSSSEIIKQSLKILIIYSSLTTKKNLKDLCKKLIWKKIYLEHLLLI